MTYFSLAIFIFVTTAFLTVFLRWDGRKNKDKIETEREVSEFAIEEIE